MTNHPKVGNIFIDFIAERIIATQMDLLRLLNDGGVNGGALQHEFALFTCISHKKVLPLQKI